MGTPFAMVSSAKAMVNLPKLSDLTINKSRSMRKSLGRERNRLARFALEEDSLEKGDSFGKNEEDEEEGKSEKLDEEESVTSAEAHERATTETNSVGEASSSKFMALKKTPITPKRPERIPTTPTKNKRIYEWRDEG